MTSTGTAERRTVRTVRTVVNALIGNWPTRIYLLGVAAAIAFAVISTATDTSGDPNFAGVWPLLVTMPWSLILIGLVSDTSGSSTVLAGLIAIVVVSALANLATIGWLRRLVRRDLTSEPTSYAPPQR